jgi:hypothetical protein
MTLPRATLFKNISCYLATKKKLNIKLKLHDIINILLIDARLHISFPLWVLDDGKAIS